MPKKTKFYKKVSRSFFIDDLNTGAKFIPEAHTLYEKLKYRWSEASFNLTKWRTNDEKLRDVIYTKEGVNREIGVTSSEKKVLGIKWDEYSDTLIIDLNDFVAEDVCNRITKRSVLSTIAGFYDAVGFIQPVVVQFKIFFQMICKEGYSWDDELKDELKKKWMSLIQNIRNVGRITIDRC